MEKIIEGVKLQGLDFLLQKIKDSDGFKKLSEIKINRDYEDVIVNATCENGEWVYIEDKPSALYDVRTGVTR